jgi:hypothetical protein
MPRAPATRKLRFTIASSAGHRCGVFAIRLRVLTGCEKKAVALSRGLCISIFAGCKLLQSHLPQPQPCSFRGDSFSGNFFLWLVVDRRSYFLSEFRRYLLHSVTGARVLSTFLHDLLLGLATSLEIAVHTNISATHDLGHWFLPSQKV